MAKVLKSEDVESAGAPESRAYTERHGVTYPFDVQPTQLPLVPELEKMQAPHQLSFSERWSALGEADPPARPIYLGSVHPWPRSRRPAPALFSSFLFHFAIVFFLYVVPFPVLFGRYIRQSPRAPETQVRMITFHNLYLADYLPAIKPSSASVAPEAGSSTSVGQPQKGTTHFDPRVTIISNTPHPDNFRLTIQTPLAPAEVKAPQDLRVPDLILGGTAAEAPVPPPAAKPAERVAPPPEPLKLATTLPPVAAPRLEVPPPPPNVEPAAVAPKPAPAPSTNPSTVHAAETAKGAEGPKLTTLAVDPIPLKDVRSLPAGNREGSFAISPEGKEKNLPGGALGVGRGAVKGGQGLGGEPAKAIGSGEPEGGGKGHPGATPSVTPSATPSVGPALSVSSRGGAPGIAAGTLAPLGPESRVYPVNPAQQNLRTTGMVVSSGPGGGGGLRVYGVLRGKKIYTIYLAMPGKHWILQFCARDEVPQTAETSRVVQMHIEPPLSPPSAVDQFDFHRSPATSELSGAMIILHGIIREDGAVINMEIQQALDPTLDEAALAAFSRWKFSPARRNGSAVAVEILVGIPAVVPAS
jgi:TonB family protein